MNFYSIMKLLALFHIYSDVDEGLHALKHYNMDPVSILNGYILMNMSIEEFLLH